MKIKNYLSLIRIKHWLKNILVFVPLFFSINFFNTNLFIKCIIGFFIFSFTSSIVYIINDIKDLDMDKKNPFKKNRVLASNKISVKNAKFLICILFILDVLLMCYLYSKNIFIFVIPFVYILINILYSCGLKRIPIVDVSIIALGFLLRVMYGGIVSGITVSNWLYLIIIFGSFYLGYGKRKKELENVGDKSRKVLSYYNENFLDKNMYVCLALTIMSYSLWTVDPTTIMRVGNEYMFWTIPLVMIIFQEYSLNIEGNSTGDPVEVIFSDKKLLLTILLYLIVLFVLVYVL